MADITDIIDVPVFHQMPSTEKDGDGEMANDLHLYLDQQSQALTQVVAQHNAGLTYPSYTNTQITAFGADTNVRLGTTWFSTTDSKLKVKTAASTIETITSA